MTIQDTQIINLKLPHDFRATTIENYENTIKSFPNTDNVKIDSIFLGPWKAHELTCNHGYFHPDNYDAYVSVIRDIQNRGYEPEILFQDRKGQTSDEVLKNYIDLGINKFTVSSDIVADKLKEMSNGNAYITASITQILSPGDICRLDENLYDEVCLFFWYRRALDLIDSLPRHFNYQLLVNAGCNGSNPLACLCHWYGDLDERYTNPEIHHCFNQSCFDLEANIELLYSKVRTFKFQGRANSGQACSALENILGTISRHRSASDIAQGIKDYFNMNNIRDFPHSNKGWD